jgi:hypothetical protein
MSENLKYWNKLSKPPLTALKKIEAGRLRGKTDINPQWRYQVMTETFGPYGIGWDYSIDKFWTEQGSGGVVMCFAVVKVRIAIGGKWSEPSFGIGGSKIVEKEKEGMHNNDEGYKMAVTDALSVALKMFGVAADIYLGNFDGVKYHHTEDSVDKPTDKPFNKTTDNPAELSKDILYRELSGYCTTADGEIDMEMMDSMLSTIAIGKDGKAKTWKELDHIDGEKYEGWFSKILQAYRGKA